MASTYLSRTVGTTSTNKNKITVSLWFKRTKIGEEHTLIGGTMTDSNRWKIRFKSSDDTLDCELGFGGSWYSLITNRKFRDTNAWYHLVYKYDSTQATASDRVKIWINGVQETSFGTANYPPQNYGNYLVENTAKVSVGTFYYQNAYYSSHRFDGCISHVHVIDGIAYDASNFGETDSTTGIWKPKTAPSVTYGNNGFFLKFENSASMGTDSSGNGNNFTVGAGTLTQTIDTPSNVFCTGNPLARFASNVDYANGNLTFNSGTGWFMGAGTMGASAGKWYYEYKITTLGTGNGYHKLGFMSDTKFLIHKMQDI